MTPKQLQWLIDATSKIPGLFRKIEGGKDSATTLLGERVINGRTVRLTFKAEVVDPGANPLQSHASVNFPTPPRKQPDYPKPEPQGQHRHARRPKRW